MGDELEVVEFDDFASGGEEEEEEVSEDIPDEIITQPAKRVTKDILLAQFPDGLVLDMHIFCEKCKTLYSARLEPQKLSESAIALIYAVEWKPRLIMTEEVAEVDQEDAIEEKIDIVQLAPIIRILAALEAPKKKSCLSPLIHEYMKTEPGQFRVLEAQRQAETLVTLTDSLSFLLTPLAFRSQPKEVHSVGYLYLSEATIQQVKAKIKKHKAKKV
jgi:hypothetical protein